jgi:membrane protease YdiL (CAAX protease family)
VLAASVATAATVVAWAVRLLEREDIRFPGLVRAGWGRWRRWGVNPGPGALEALGLVAVAAAGMTLGAGLFIHAPPAALVMAPLMLFVALPALGHAWLGAYRPAQLYWSLPRGRDLGLAALLAVPAIGLTVAVGSLQQAAVDPQLLKPIEEQMQRILGGLQATGGLPLVLLAAAVTPAICEELLCRGPVLAGLRRALGPTGAVIISALLFAALHQSPFRFVPQALLGVMLAVLTLRTGSVAPAMVVHALHNGALVVAASLSR